MEIKQVTIVYFILFNFLYSYSKLDTTATNLSEIPLRIPIEIPNDSEIEKDLCEYYYGEEPLWGNLIIKSSLWRDRDAKVTLNENNFTLASHLYYWLDIPGWYQCGLTDELPRELIARIEGNINIDTTYKISINTSPKLEFLNECIFGSGFIIEQINVTPFLEKRAYQVFNNVLERFSFLMEQKYSKMKDTIDNYWHLLQEPVQIDSSYWISLNPSFVKMGKITSENNKFFVNIILVCKPEIIYGKKPGKTLENQPQLKNEEISSISAKIILKPEIHTSYEAINQYLNDTTSGIINTKFIQGEYIYQIKSAKIKNKRGKISLDIKTSRRHVDFILTYPKEVNKPIRNWNMFKLTGNLTLNELSKELYFDELELAELSKNKKNRNNKWLNLVDSIKYGFNIPLSLQINNLSDKVTKYFNSALDDRSTFSGSFNIDKLDSVYFDNNSVVTKIKIFGEAVINLK